MTKFWEETKKTLLALAYYRHSAQNKQEHSIAIQREAVHAYANTHGIKIIKEFEDSGKSGVSIEGRDGIQDLLEYVRKYARKDGILYIICYDVSRWGRFQNTVEASEYKAECAKYGVRIIYVVHGDPSKNDGDIDSFHDVQVLLEEKSAGQYLRNLSQKVLLGTKKVARLGFRAGGSAPYGTVRIELSEQREFLGVMKPKQYKTYPNNRVKLAPDDKIKGNAKTVSDIFEYFVTNGLSESQIAEKLNAQNIPSPGGGTWNTTNVRNILKNEQYAGSVVYNRTSSTKIKSYSLKPKSKTIRNPRDEWIVTPNSFEPIITWDIFQQAQEIFRLRNLRMSREEMLEKIQNVLNEYNMLSHSLLNDRPKMPTRREIIKEFGSLPEAFNSLYPDVLKRVRNDVRTEIESEACDVLEYEDFLVINQMFTIKIVPVIPFPRGYGFQWYFRIDKRPCIDITLGVPLKDEEGSQILGYFPFPRVLTDESLICVADSSAFKIGLYGHLNLRLIIELIRWSNSYKKETTNG